MNFRKLITYLTMGTAAAMPLAVAQNPTILQGSYISNVFGNSNFIKNPNAQTNIAEVTVSNATVTRSTTTPLVATSEFLVTTSTATGSATWSTRTFDSGMKGQNCEARFSYRGFSVGSTTAQIVQGSNVVAQLTLTPSTDPRIASINFPCGDLSSATTFRLQQATASLTGTNEIGAIYVGLATNMANVAQAEYIGYGGYANGGAITYWDTSTSESYMAVNSVGTGGAETSSSSIIPEPISVGNLLRVRFNNLKPGNYHATFTGPLHKDNSGVTGTCAYTLTPVTVSSGASLSNEGEVFTYNLNSVGQDPNPAGGTLTSNFSVTSTQDVYLYIKVSNASGICRASVGVTTGKRMRFHLHRFPSSSELVVTPERQNWYISAYHGGANPLLSTAAVASRTEITNGSLSLTPTVGSQPAATLCSGTNAPPALSTSATTCAAGNESVGLTFNIPSTGIYEVCAAFGTNVEANAASSADTVFSIEETSTTSATNLTTNPSIPRYSSSSTAQTATTYPTTKCQLFNFSSLGQKAVRLMYMQNVTGTVTQNLVIADAVQGRIVQWTVTPVTNQSNSALYVEGPVKAAATGAAIPSGYAGNYQIISLGTTTGSTTSGTRTTVSGSSFTLQPGVWRITVIGNIFIEGCSGSAGSGQMARPFAVLRRGGSDVVSQLVASCSTTATAQNNPVSLIYIDSITSAQSYDVQFFWLQRAAGGISNLIWNESGVSNSTYIIAERIN